MNRLTICNFIYCALVAVGLILAFDARFSPEDGYSPTRTAFLTIANFASISSFVLVLLCATYAKRRKKVPTYLNFVFATQVLAVLSFAFQFRMWAFWTFLGMMVLIMLVVWLFFRKKSSLSDDCFERA